MRWLLCFCMLLLLLVALLLRRQLEKTVPQQGVLRSSPQLAVVATSSITSFKTPPVETTLRFRSGASQKTPTESLAPLTLEQPWSCHVFDKRDTDINWYDGFDNKDQILCERTHGDGFIYKFTNGSNLLAPGCGDCKCCMAKRTWRCHAWTKSEVTEPHFSDKQTQRKICERERNDGVKYRYTFGDSALTPGCPAQCACCKSGFTIPPCEYSTVRSPSYTGTSSESRPSLSQIPWDEYYTKAQTEKCEKFTRGDIGYYPDVYTYDSWHNYLPTIVGVLKTFIAPQSSAVVQLMEKGDIYMFGVAQGESMAYMNKFFEKQRLFGFDSFKGLPKETAKMIKASNWEEGAYKPAATLEEIVKDAGGPEIARVIPGFFNESLHPKLVEQEGMRPAFYVDIDCDLYSSTMPALEFLFANRIIQVGTLIGYDDWWTVPCRKYHSIYEETCMVSPMHVGEGLAHAHITAKYGVRFRCVAGPCRPQPKSFNYRNQCDLHNSFGPLFIVEAIGDPAFASTGFEFNTEQERQFLEYFTFCNTC